jgi:hypothetical protein
MTDLSKLFTCPRCQTPNFTARGLRSHVCRKNGRQPLLKAEVEKSIAEQLSRPDRHNDAGQKDSAGPLQRPSEAREAATAAGGAAPVGTGTTSLRSKGTRPLAIAEFENLGPSSARTMQPENRVALANQYHELARLSMAQSCAYMILAGMELLALKADAEHGTWEKLFADHRSGKSRNVSTFAFSYDSARNYMRLADGAKKNVPALRELCSSDVPLSQMPDEQRDKIVAAVRKAGDGNTYKDLALEWGLVKKPPGNGGGSQGGSESPAETLTPEQAAERNAQDLFHSLALSLFQGCSEGEKQKLLLLPVTSDKPGDVTGLADLRDHVSAFLALVDEALEAKKKAIRKGGAK